MKIYEKYERFYKQKCFDNIKKEYLPREKPYTDKIVIETTCKKCIEFLVIEFEKECTNITTCGDLYWFMENYSRLHIKKY